MAVAVVAENDLLTCGGNGARFFLRFGLSTVGLTVPRSFSSLKGFASSNSFSVKTAICDLANLSLNLDLGNAGEHV